MKRKSVVILAALILLIALIFAKNLIAKAALLTSVKTITGLNLSIKDMDIGTFKTLIGVKELRLYNPPEFEDKLMVDMPEIYIDYNLAVFFKKKVHLEELRLNLKEFVVVKNEKGQLNLDALRVVKEKKTAGVAQKKEKSEIPQIQIDELRLKIGRVIYKDYSKGPPPKIREFNINIDERYQNISDPYTFTGLILARALMKTPSVILADLGLDSLIDGLSGISEGVATLGRDALKKSKEKATEVVDQALQKTSDTIKKIIPFGE